MTTLFQMRSRGPAGKKDRPSRGSRRALQVWWPPALLVALGAGLWLLWPDAPHARPARPTRLPEPGAAYVTLEEGAQSLYLKLDIFTSPSGLGFGRTRSDMDVREAPAPRARPSPELLPAPTPKPWHLADVATARPQAPRLADVAVNLPSPAPAPATNGVRIVLSAGLRQAAFAFDLPRSALPAASGRILCHVELDDAGRVSQILVDKEDAPLDSRGAEAAVSQGRGSGPAQGRVDIAWR